MSAETILAACFPDTWPNIPYLVAENLPRMRTLANELAMLAEGGEPQAAGPQVTARIIELKGAGGKTWKEIASQVNDEFGLLPKVDQKICLDRWRRNREKADSEQATIRNCRIVQESPNVAQEATKCPTIDISKERTVAPEEPQKLRNESGAWDYPSIKGRIFDLAGTGLDVKAIARVLQSEGIDMDWRRVRGIIGGSSQKNAVAKPHAGGNENDRSIAPISLGVGLAED